MGRTVFRYTLLILAFFVVLTLAVLGWGSNSFHAPGSSTDEVTLVLSRGASVEDIARELGAAGVIRQPLVLSLAARITGRAGDVRAGEYAFSAGINPREALNKMIRGETVVRRVTVAEGLTSPQALALLAAAQGLEGKVTAVAEGSLLPETYHYTYGDSRRAMVERMQRAMREALRELWPNRAPDLPFETPEQAVVLASIVEKETGLAAERAHIAGVFVNRLRRRMRLQSDPTVAYALTSGKGNLARPLTRTDLAIDSPFNTYRIVGLPPAPIANPGRAAIMAVLDPLVTTDLYFVADGSGGHAFARTLAEHNRNARRYRRLNKAAD